MTIETTQPVSDLAVDIRGDFPVLQRKVDGQEILYLDSAATSLKPKPVIDAINQYYQENCSNIHRGKHFLSEEVSNRYEEARYSVASFLCCKSTEIVFTRNTTESINMIANGLQLTKQDKVLGFLDSHHSLILPWQEKATLELVGITSSGSVDLDEYEAKLKSHPKIVLLTACSNVTGQYIPLEKMVLMAKQAGAIVIVDAAQYQPHRKINLSLIPIDFYAFSSHKIMGPSGVGVLFGRIKLLELLKPGLWGGGMVDWVETNTNRPRKLPHRLEAGTPAIEAALGLQAALDYFEDLDFELVMEHDKWLAGILVNQVNKRERLRLLGSENADRTALVSVAISGVADLSELVKGLSDHYGIMCRSGHLCAQPMVDRTGGSQVLRCSAYVYNTQEDIVRFFSALDQLLVEQ